jgi:TolA-binding protein
MKGSADMNRRNFRVLGMPSGVNLASAAGLPLLPLLLFSGSNSQANQKSAGADKAQSKVAAVETSLDAAAVRRVQPGEQESVSASGAIKKDLGQVSSDSLLKQGRAFKARGGESTVTAEKRALKEAKRMERSLRFGVFRNEGLADGSVSAPGIEDFAAFFRASSSATAPDAKSVLTGRIGDKDEAYMARQSEAEKLRKQTIESIKKILATSPPPEQKINLLMRMAEIQIESHGYILELEIQTFSKAYDEWMKTRKGAEPTFSDKNSKARLLAGIETLRTASKEFPEHVRAPEILFNLGFLLNQVGSDSAKLYFEQLVKKFPDSDYVPKAYLALGEFHFQKTQFGDALKMYQAVLKYKGTEAYNYAVYKIAWTYFNLPGKNAADHKENLGKSLAGFRLLIKLSDAPEASPMLKNVRGDALKDMVLVFVELKDIDGAEKFYASLGETELYYTFLERLAWQTTEAGEFDAAASIYRKLIDEAKTHKRMPTYLSRLVEVQEKRQEFQALLTSLKFMSSTLAKDSPWYQANNGNAEVISDRDTALAKAFRYWPKYLHAQAQKTKRPEYYAYALEAYLVHLQNTPQDADAFDAYFYSAEIYVYQKRYEDAAAHYAKAVVIDEKHKLGNKLTRDSLLNAIASLDMAVVEKQAPVLPEPGKATSVIPFPSLQARLVWCLDAFTRLFPSDDDSIALAHRAARYHYAFGDYRAAQERWLAVAKRAPKSNEAGEGIRMALRVQLNREDWQETRNVGNAFLGVPGIKDAYVSRDIVGVMKVALFQLALQREREKKHAEAESLFVSYQKEYPDDADAPKALYNAANNAFKSGNMDSALTRLKTLLSQHPKSDLVADALNLIASSMDGLGQFAESATYYEQLMREHGTHRLAEPAAFRVIQLRKALEREDAVESSARQFLAKWPSSKFAPEAWLLLGQSLEARSRFQLALDTYLEGARVIGNKRPNWAVYFYARAAIAADAASNDAERGKYLTLGLKTYERLGNEERGLSEALDGIAEIAKMRVSDIEKEFARVTKLKITDGLKLTDQFTAIRADVEKIGSQYASVIKIGNAEAGIQALFRVAELQAFLSATLLNAPVPQGASAVEAEQFKGTLERIALPLQEEAANLFLTAWQRAKETEAMTPFSAEIYKKLVELRPSEYRKLDSRLPSPSYFSSKLILNNETTQFVGR